jgi:hypothetical protein
MNKYDVPVIINNRNRYSMLHKLVQWLEAAGTQDIVIIDNASTYEPLLDYYRRSPHSIVRLKENVGYLSFWEMGLDERFRDQHFIFTDPDVLPVDECPEDYLELFLEGLKEHPDIGKVGLSLKIDDLPDSYAMKAQVIQHEKEHWKAARDKRFLVAPIDTTFALYRPNTRGGYWVPALRTAPPYTARHLPWYVNSSTLDEEEIYYNSNANQSASWVTKMGALKL